MVHAIILLVRELGMSLVIEGIETQSQLNFIKPIAGINAQGLYFSKPLKPSEISKWESQICDR